MSMEAEILIVAHLVRNVFNSSVQYKNIVCMR
jgi:hypothetical protein